MSVVDHDNKVTIDHPLVQKKMKDRNFGSYIRSPATYPKRIEWNYHHDWYSLLMTEKGRGYVRRTSTNKCILIIPRSKRTGSHLNNHPPTLTRLHELYGLTVYGWALKHNFGLSRAKDVFRTGGRYVDWRRQRKILKTPVNLQIYDQLLEDGLVDTVVTPMSQWRAQKTLGWLDVHLDITVNKVKLTRYIREKVITADGGEDILDLVVEQVMQNEPMQYFDLLYDSEQGDMKWVLSDLGRQYQVTDCLHAFEMSGLGGINWYGSHDYPSLVVIKWYRKSNPDENGIFVYGGDYM